MIKCFFCSNPVFSEKSTFRLCDTHFNIYLNNKKNLNSIRQKLAHKIKVKHKQVMKLRALEVDLKSPATEYSMEMCELDRLIGLKLKLKKISTRDYHAIIRLTLHERL